MSSVPAAILQRVLDRLSQLADRKPSPQLPRQLNNLFRDLQSSAPPRPMFETEDMIWALWCEHADPGAAQQMELATRAIAARRFDAALAYLDALVLAHPDWAEAWNKRATLYFIDEKDADALTDIAQTIDIEPRHFGALCGLGMLCERLDEPEAARFAYRCALAVHPGLESIQARVAMLDAQLAALN